MLSNVKRMIFSNFEIYTSPSKRCIQTINKLKLGSYNVSDDLKEINYGKADGLFFDEVIDQYKYISDSIEKEDEKSKKTITDLERIDMCKEYLANVNFCNN